MMPVERFYYVIRTGINIPTAINVRNCTMEWMQVHRGIGLPCELRIDDCRPLVRGGRRKTAADCPRMCC